MGGSKPRTKFEPVQLKAEPEWYVRITLPHGEDIHIDEFKTEAEARAWIDDKSADFFTQKSTREADTPQGLNQKVSARASRLRAKFDAGEGDEGREGVGEVLVVLG